MDDDLSFADSLLQLDAEDLGALYATLSDWEFNFTSLDVGSPATSNDHYSYHSPSPSPSLLLLESQQPEPLPVAVAPPSPLSLLTAAAEEPQILCTPSTDSSSINPNPLSSFNNFPHFPSSSTATCINLTTTISQGEDFEQLVQCLTQQQTGSSPEDEEENGATDGTNISIKVESSSSSSTDDDVRMEEGGDESEEGSTLSDDNYRRRRNEEEEEEDRTVQELSVEERLPAMHDRLPSYYTALASSSSAPWIPPATHQVYNKLPDYITDVSAMDANQTEGDSIIIFIILSFFQLAHFL